MRKIGFVFVTTIDCFQDFFYHKDREPLGRAAQQRGARTGRACAARTARVGRLQPTGGALVTALSRGEGVVLIFEVPEFLRERILRLLDVAPCTHLPIGFVLTILLAIRKIDPFMRAIGCRYLLKKSSDRALPS